MDSMQGRWRNAMEMPGSQLHRDKSMSYRTLQTSVSSCTKTGEFYLFCQCWPGLAMKFQTVHRILSPSSSSTRVSSTPGPTLGLAAGFYQEELLALTGAQGGLQDPGGQHGHELQSPSNECLSFSSSRVLIEEQGIAP